MDRDLDQTVIQVCETGELRFELPSSALKIKALLSDASKIKLDEISAQSEEVYRGIKLVYEAPNQKSATYGFTVFSVVLGSTAYSYYCGDDDDFDYELNTIQQLAHTKVDSFFI